MGKTRYWCAVIASLIWLGDGVLVVWDWVTTGSADWVPFLAFTGLMVLLAAPVLLGKE